MEGVPGLLLPHQFALSSNLSGSSVLQHQQTNGSSGFLTHQLFERSSKNTNNLFLDGNELGGGSYGTVYKAKYNCLPCAVKILHPRFQKGGGQTEVAYRECTTLLSTLRHPNIVLFIDVQHYWPPSPSLDSQPLIALIMERMDENLTVFLKRHRRYGNIPWHTLVGISHDVALALHYLHTRGISYLILSSNNVLLLKDRAKISDPGLTRVPGVQSETAYTAPETRMNKPGMQSDVFSFGVLLLQMITLKYPEPKFMLSHDMSSGSLTMATELSRRKSDVALIPRKHKLRPLVLHCIADSEQTRPTTEELCTDFETMKTKKLYQQSIAKHSKTVESSDDSTSSSESDTNESSSSEDSDAESD